MNYSAKSMFHIYKYVYTEETKIVSEFKSCPIKKAFGNFYINITDALCETGSDDLRYKYVGYGGVCFLGNINGKTSNELFYKNQEIKQAVEKLINNLDTLRTEQHEAIRLVREQHGEPRPQYALIADMARKNK